VVRAEDAEKRAADLDARLHGTDEELRFVRAELERVLGTRTMRWSRQARSAYGRLRSLRSLRGRRGPASHG
jgi:hypothetical protein